MAEFVSGSPRRWWKTKRVRSPVVPTLRYRDLDGAIAWLQDALGFTTQHAVYGHDGGIQSAQLACGRGLIMVTAIGQSVFDDLLKQPDEIGGAETQSCYFIIDDCETHYARAVEHGAAIVLDMQAFEDGGRGYMCRDPEGHLWSFGTYDPWSLTAAGGQASSNIWHAVPWQKIPHGDRWRAYADKVPISRNLALGAAAVVFVAAVAAASISWRSGTGGIETASISSRPSAIALFKERGARLEAERQAAVTNAELAQLRQQKDAADLELAKLQEQNAHAVASRDEAEKTQRSAGDASTRLNDQLARLQQAKDTAERFSRISIAKSLRDRQARDKQRRRLSALGQEANQERQARQRAEKALSEMRGELQRETATADSADADRRQTREALLKEQKARADAEKALQDAVAQLKREQEARKTAEAAASATEADSNETAKKFTPPRPATRPERRRN